MPNFIGSARRVEAIHELTLPSYSIIKFIKLE